MRALRPKAVAVLISALAITGLTPLSAAADEPDGSDQAQLQALASEIAALEATSDEQARAAQEANERYLDAKADADEADEVLEQAREDATEAQAVASESRSRAAAVAARLARTDLSTMPLDLLLNEPSARDVLGGLSSTGQLSTQADALLRRASSDAEEARNAQRSSERSAVAAEDAADTAGSTYREAKRDAKDAEDAVEAAKAREQALLDRIAAQDDTDLAAVCGALDAPPAACSADEQPGGAPVSSAGGSEGDRVVAFARSQIGEPYVFAAAGPSSWDCSGLTLGAWQSVGVTIGIHSATAQYRTAQAAGRLVPVADARPGDLLFYSDGSGSMYHTTIYSGGGNMVEAPSPGKSVREVPVRTADLVGQAARPS